MTAAEALCPVCAASGCGALEDHFDAVGKTSYTMRVCPQCALVFAQPLKFPGGAWYEAFNYVCGYEETANAASKTVFPFILDRLPQGAKGRLLDVGCAAGRFLKMAAERGFEVEGLDVDSRFVAQARALGLSGVRQGLLDAAFAQAHAGLYDAVSILEVLEHVDDPPAFLGLCRAVLKPGGILIVAVPDNRRPTPFGRDLWDYPPHHLTRWGPKALTLALERAGFSIALVSSTPLHTAEFSRVWADRSARWILRVIKRLMFGAGSSAKPMDALLAGAGTGAPAASRLPDKSTRVRLVDRYHSVFMAATFPLFFFMRLYYGVTRPDAGLALLVMAKRTG